MELGRSRAEVELTKKLAATLVQKEVMEPLNAIGWTHGTPPTAEMLAAYAAKNASATGQPGTTEGAPAVTSAPVTPAQNGQPAPVQTAPAPAVVAKTDASSTAEQNVVALFESLRDANGLIMGKYKDVTSALKGAGHLANMAKDALGRAEAAEAALVSARTASSPSPAPPVTAPVTAPAIRPVVSASRADLDAVQARLDKVLSKINEDGVLDGENARQYASTIRELSEVSGRVAAEEVRLRAEEAQNAENEKWNAVNGFMKDKYPDSVLFSDEVGLHVRSNPLLADAVSALVAQGRETRAAEFAWQEFDKARGGSPSPSRADAERTEIELAAREQVRKEARDAALKDAGVIHGSAGGSSAVETPGVTGPSQDDINSYAAGMRREGDSPGSASAARWRQAVIGRFLPPNLFGPQEG